MFRHPEDLRTIDDLLDFYRRADETILPRLTSLDQRALAQVCRDSRRLAEARGHSARQLALRHGYRIIEESFSVAGGRIQLMGECSFAPGQPAVILINRAAIDLVSRRTLQLVGRSEAAWFATAWLDDLTIAHELYHLLTGASASPLTELGAHVFARALTKWPFSPLLLPALLQRPPGESNRSRGQG